MLLSTGVEAIRQDHQSEDELTSQFFNFMQISDEQKTEKAEQIVDKENAWDMVKQRSKGFVKKEKELFGRKEQAELKFRGDEEQHQYEHALAQNQDVQLDADVGLSNEEDDAIKAVEASLAQFGIKVPEGKHDMATVQNLLRQALAVESTIDGGAP